MHCISFATEVNYIFSCTAMKLEIKLLRSDKLMTLIKARVQRLW